MSLPMIRLAASIFERELALSNPKEETMYDVYYLSADFLRGTRTWIRYAIHRPLRDARAVARAVSSHGNATWIRPHSKGLDEGIIPTGAA